MLYPEFNRQRKLTPGAFLVETIRAVQYLEELSALARVNLETWDMRIFRDDHRFQTVGDFVIRDNRTEINRVFWTEMEKRKSRAEVPPEVDMANVSLLAADTEQLRESILQEQSNQLDKQARTLIQQACDAEYQINSRLVEANKLRLKSEQLMGRSRDMRQRVASILELGSWTYQHRTGSILSFVTNREMILQYRNDPSKEHYRVNFGVMQANLDVVNAKLYVRAHPEPKVIVDGHYHPHISESGKVCWGDSLDIATKKLVEGDYKTVFSLLYSVLSNYTVGNPYCSESRGSKTSSLTRCLATLQPSARGAS